MLSHFLQRHGIATSSISLIREQSEAVHPPRALWVPFPLGRPLGVADDPEFQTDVLRSALGLLETATEPMIADYPHDAPDGGGDGVWACAIELPAPEVSELESSLRAEIDLLMPRYLEARRKRGRTTFGMSGATLEQMDQLVTYAVAVAEGCGFNRIPASATGPDWIHPTPMLVRFVVEDLRAFYQEAVTSDEEAGPPSQHDMHSWIFEATALGRLIKRIAQLITDDDDPRLLFVRGLLIPEGFWQGGPTFGGPPPGEDPREFLIRSRRYLQGVEA
ncbi:MAG: hypothetical protein OXI41_03435 [Chloroflexota bacterium]|nr:hypothetical protein [Chloroflexota bacterium]MDE2895514.1 hypothetical protein [Chloroflexota bacterium]